MLFFVIILYHITISYHYPLEAYLFTERENGKVSGWEGTWGGTGTNSGGRTGDQGVLVGMKSIFNERKK